MTLNERLLEFLSGSLAPDDEAELLHTLSVSPEKRGALRDFMNGDRLLARDRAAIEVPYEAERRLWSRLDAVLPLAQPAVVEENAAALLPLASAQMTSTTLGGMLPSAPLAGTPIVGAPMVGAPLAGWWSRAVLSLAGGAMLLLTGLGAGYYAGNSNAAPTAAPVMMTASAPHVSEQRETVLFNVLGPDRTPVASTRATSSAAISAVADGIPVRDFAAFEQHQRLADAANYNDAAEPLPERPISTLSLRGTRPIAPMAARIGDSRKAQATLLDIAEPETEKSVLQRFEFAVDESFGRQFPNSDATNNSLPLVTNSSLGAFFQVLPHSDLLWIGATYGTANVTQQSLFKHDYNPIDPVQEVLASDTVHSQTSYVAGYLQFRFPAFPSAEITLTGGYGLASIGQMLMGEIGMHYNLTGQIGVNFGVRARSFSYDLTQAKEDAIHTGTGSLAVPAGVGTSSASVNTELTTGLFFHF